MLEAFSMPFFQRGLLEILILAIPAGLVGSWVVLRGLAFFSHAIGTASFPGLVLADGIGFSPALGAFGAAGFFAGLSSLLGRNRRASNDSVTALVLVGCLALGVILASDVFGSTASVDTLLFGSLLSISSSDIWLAAGAAAVATLSTVLLGLRWLSRGFDEASASRDGSGSSWLDAALLFTVAVTVTASLNAVGALLVSVLIVVPAATVRLFARRVNAQLVASVLLVGAQGSFGLWLSFQTDAPPGATIAVVSGVTFAVALIGRSLGRRGIRASAAAALLVGAGLIAGCGGSGSGSSGDQVKVVATTTQVGDLVEQVGGDRVDLTTILQPNTDPHEYEPRPSDVKAVADAELVFRSGGHLDDWADDIVADSGSGAEVIDLSEGLPVQLEGSEEHDHAHEDEHAHEEEHAHADEEEHADEAHAHEEEHADGAHEGETGEHGDEVDPHWWHDPVNVVAATGEIEEALSQTAPDDAHYFADRASAFEKEAETLSRQIAKCINRIPEAERKIVTDHDAFGYYTHRFGIESVGTVIPALTTQAEPSAGDLAELEQTIREEKVKAVFPESSLSPTLAEAVSKDTGASTDYILYADTLGPEDSNGATWIQMMKANTDSLMLGMSGGKKECFGTVE